MLVELQRERGQLRKLVTFKLGSKLMYPVNFFFGLFANRIDVSQVTV
jgi:hypothetical protein